MHAIGDTLIAVLRSEETKSYSVTKDDETTAIFYYTDDGASLGFALAAANEYRDNLAKQIMDARPTVRVVMSEGLGRVFVGDRVSATAAVFAGGGHGRLLPADTLREVTLGTARLVATAIGGVLMDDPNAANSQS